MVFEWSACLFVSLTNAYMSMQQPQRQSVPYASSVAPSRNPENSVVVLVVVLGSRTVEITATQILITRGWKVCRPANAHGLQIVRACSRDLTMFEYSFSLSVSLTNMYMAMQQLRRQSVPYASSVVPSRNLENSAVALPAVLGSRTVAITAAQRLSTRGSKECRPAKVHDLQRVRTYDCANHV